MTISMKMIEIENLTGAYGKKRVLQDVSLHAERGECIGIVGPNGCGKSTLLSLIAGLLPPEDGLCAAGKSADAGAQRVR